MSAYREEEEIMGKAYDSRLMRRLLSYAAVRKMFMLAIIMYDYRRNGPS